MRSGFDGVVLAGGDSARMGRDKALVRLPSGATLLENAVDSLRKAGAGRIWVSRAHQDPADDGCAAKCLPDLLSRRGPAGGMLTALAELSAEPLVFLPCDMPRIPVAWLRRLGRRAREDLRRPMVTVSGAGRLQPLVCALPQGCLPPLANAVARGHLAVGRLLSDLDASVLQGLEEIALLNVNHYATVRHLEQMPGGPACC